MTTPIISQLAENAARVATRVFSVDQLEEAIQFAIDQSTAPLIAEIIKLQKDKEQLNQTIETMEFQKEAVSEFISALQKDKQYLKAQIQALRNDVAKTTCIALKYCQPEEIGPREWWELINKPR